MKICPMSRHGAAALLVASLVAPLSAAASTCPIDVSSPATQFSVASFFWFGVPDPAALVCATTGELPIESTHSGGGEHYMTGRSRIVRPGEFLYDVLATGNGSAANYFMTNRGEIHLGDVMITGGPGASVDGALNLAYGGRQIECAVSNPARCHPGAAFTVRAGISTSGPTPLGGYSNFDFLWGADETGSVPLFNLPVGTPFRITVEITQPESALAFTTGTQRWEGFVGFLPSRVFELPPGYTARSVEGRIADNQWPVSEADQDGDGVPDASDNCPSVANSDQLDRGGVGGSTPDGVGDACQCGDVNGSGSVTQADAVVLLRSRLSPPTATMAHPELCDVGGTVGCSLADAIVVQRAILSPPSASIVPQCGTASP